MRQLRVLVTMPVILLHGIMLLPLALGALLFAISQPTNSAVYSVPQLQGLMAQDPSSWIGRTVLVRGEITSLADHRPMSQQVGPVGTGAQPNGAEQEVQPTSPDMMIVGPALYCSTAGVQCPATFLDGESPWTVGGEAALSPVEGDAVPGAGPLMLAILPSPHASGQPLDWSQSHLYQVRVTGDPTSPCQQDACDDGVLIRQF